jgi:two-component system sensor histidine kinase DegS
MGLLNQSEPNPWEEFKQFVSTELQESKRALNEITLMLDQSQAELAKLTQRNTVITSHVQQIVNQLDLIPRSDIVSAYNASLDAQQRLLVMRTQLEKLQSERDGLKKLNEVLQHVQNSMDSDPSGMDKGNNGTAIVEMLIDGQESVRQRLSRQMHDGPAQTLSNFIVQAEIAARLLEIDPTKAKEELNNLKVAAMSTFQKVRSFIFELRPMMLDDLGLVPTLKRYIDTFKEQTGCEVQLSVKGHERRLDGYVEVMIFRALQELIGNAEKHNQELPHKVRIEVDLMIDENLIRTSVTDNGKGFAVNTVNESGGLGLKFIKQRVELLGGVMEIDSLPGKGTRIALQIPV